MSKTSCVLGCVLAVALSAVAGSEDAPKNSSSPKPITFQTPRGWQPAKAGEFVDTRFQIGQGLQSASVTIVRLDGDGGGPAANVNRWRTQIGLKVLSESAAQKLLQPMEIDGVAGQVVDLTGPPKNNLATQQILGVIVMRIEGTWFFKLSGPENVVERQRPAFVEFLKSVRFAK